MKNLDIIIPVKNEEANILPLVQRVSKALNKAKISYKLIFIDDRSVDKTVNAIEVLKEVYPIESYTKKGKPGKAFSIIEGASYSNSENLAMIDADLQYPPEALPQMFEQLSDSGLVIAKRKVNHGSKIRRFVSCAFGFVFGKAFHNIDLDIQSGLKVFKREVIEKIDVKKISPWTLDLSLVLTARDLGLGISQVNIDFEKRKNGKSKVSIVRTSLEIGKNAFKLKFFRKRQFYINPTDNDSMAGSGIALKGKRYITHTTLEEKFLALKTFSLWQKTLLGLIAISIIAGFFLNPLITILFIVGFLSVIYFADVVFNIGVMLKSLHFPPEIKISDEEIANLSNKNLPIYTILCPLYREAKVLPHFLESIEKLDWPKDKLDVILLLEEDDKETIAQISNQTLPEYVRVLVTPDSQPKTKPKACNYGLSHAKGEYLVVYDAEDMPERDQLKKAYLGFRNSGKKVVCLQAKLNYFNPHQNLLTRFFTAEYSLWFDVVLPGLQSINTVIPLGGTSNHFRTEILRQLKGWDPFNVTEDCDLGVRIFKKGLRTAIIDSVTLEEANSNLGNWVRQRSRWIKGYMQTYFVHMRNPFEFIREHGLHAFVFQLIIGARISFMLINPILWATTISYFVFYAYVGPAIEEVFPTIIFYLAVTSLLIGNFSYIYNYMIGAVKRGNYGLVKYIFLIPFYWLVASWAAVIASYQLIAKPHYWEKTVHGFHLDSEKIIPVVTVKLLGDSWYKKLGLAISGKGILTGSVFIILSFLAGVLNLGFNIYLGRVASFEDLGMLTLIGGLMYFSWIPQSALTNTVTHKVGFLEGKNRPDASAAFFKQSTKKFLLVSYVLSGLWLMAIPYLAKYFNTKDFLPFLLFTPIWTFGIGSSLIKGFMSGKLMLEKIGFLMIVEAVIKFLIAFSIIRLGFSSYVYISIPLSIVLALLISLLVVSRYLKIPKKLEMTKKDKAFPYSFYAASSLSILAPIAFLSMDVLLAKHFLSPLEAGKYSLISVIGKIVYFVGALVPQLILPFVSRNEGAKKSSDKLLLFVFIATFIITAAGYVVWGKFSSFSVPFIFGQKSLEILPLLEPFTFAMICFSLSQIFVSYYLAKKVYTFPITAFLLAIVQFFLISFNNQDVKAIVFDMYLMGLLNLAVMFSLHSLSSYIMVFESNIKDFLGLLSRTLPFDPQSEKKLKILIFNWRDIKHTWAGGAENYIHELSSLWVKEGYQVTIFCGNDGLNPRYEVIDGVQVVRRGGFYTVYFWAFLYYIFRFKGLYDLVIDSENGIPFFTPLYVGKSKLLLIHHIHQEVFRNHLPLPLALTASFLEAKLMPLIYKKQRVITVSESSKAEILKLGKDIFGSIEIVNPGIHVDKFLNLKKTKNPSFLYLGRLQPYKNVDVVLRAFPAVIKKFPKAVLTIAGSGESLNFLKQLALNLKIEKFVKFLGKVSDDEKYKLLSQSWVMVQPSMIEGWGITVIEANASFTPVIASNVNGLKDSVIDGKTGLLIKPKDIKMFAAAMIDLAENKDFREYLSRQGHKWAQNFSWKESASKFLSIIKEDISSTNLKRLILNRLPIKA